MSIERKQNKGFTLIELIIAIAMLAFLMTAVSAFMASGMANYKKAKADVRVHNSAQENYDLVSDSIMEAKDIYLFGYKNNDSTLYCFVRDDSNKTTKQEDNVEDVQDQIGMSFAMGTTDAVVDYFSNISDTDVIYIRALVVDTAEQITEEDFNTLTVEAGNKVLNTFTGNKDVIEERTDSEGVKRYSVDDIERQMFVFDEENMYYMVKYAYVTSKNDNVVDAGSSANATDYLYSSSFEIAKNGNTFSTAKFDVENGAMSVDFIYSDKNMTYTTNGMIKCRNSFVINAKKGKGDN